MKLLQWLVPLETGGVASAITRRDASLLHLPAAGLERARGPVLDVPELSLALTVARPLDEPSEEGPPVERVTLSLVLVADAEPPAAAPLGRGEDAVGLLSLLGEYAIGLAKLLAALELPLGSISPSAEGALEVQVGPLQSYGGRRAGWTLVLLAGAADVLARARGFRVQGATARVDDEAWLPVDGALPTTLAERSSP